MNNIGIFDADLTLANHRFPNLACMKLSAYFKAQGHQIMLLSNCDQIPALNPHDWKIYISCVFSSTAKIINAEYLTLPNVTYGGTGFHYDKYDSTCGLSSEIEHIKPDYHLYDDWVEIQKNTKLNNGKKEAAIINDLKYYTDYSIGFTTRGCNRHCEFCVNKNSNASIMHSPLMEFYNEEKKRICLLDDNILACTKRDKILDELIEKTNTEKKCFEYKQGMDIRMMTEGIAIKLAAARYCGDFIFAFDNIKDSEMIKRKTELFRKHIPDKSTKFYVFCGYKDQSEQDIITVFERLRILWAYQCTGYVMRHENYLTALNPYKGMFVQLARWCNQVGYQKKLTFRVFCNKSGGSSAKVMAEFEKLHPDIAEMYFDMAYPFNKSIYLDPEYNDEYTKKAFTPLLG